MDLTNRNAPVRFPRTEADAMSELPLIFGEGLEREPALADRADLEPKGQEVLSNRKTPFFLRTEADKLAEERAHGAWLTRLISES